MEFTVYSSTATSEAVEAGLSGGEVRQALLDRLRSVLQGQHFTTVPSVASFFARLFSPEELSSATVDDDSYATFEDRLYALSDEELGGTSWELPTETIYVTGDAS